jgi:hypothetical protein
MMGTIDPPLDGRFWLAIKLIATASVEKKSSSVFFDDAQDICIAALTYAIKTFEVCLHAMDVYETHTVDEQALRSILMEGVLCVQLKLEPQVNRTEEPAKKLFCTNHMHAGHVQQGAPVAG